MRWTRREAIGGAAGMLASSLVVQPARSSRAREHTVTLCSYGGVFEKGYREAVVEPFMRANPQIEVNYYGVMTSAQMLGTLRAQRASPQIDVCLFDVMSAKLASDEGLLDFLDRASLPVIGELSSRAIVPGVAGPAATFVHLVLLYAPSSFRTPPDTWKVLWDRVHDGEIAIQGPPNAVGVAFTLLAGFMAGASDHEEACERGIASVAAMARRVLSWDPKPDPYAFIVNGMATLGVGWNARAQIYAQQAAGRIAAGTPRQGTIAYMDMITAVRNSPAPESARQFIAYALSAEAQTKLAERMFYTPTNRLAPISVHAAGRVASTTQIAAMLPVSWPEIANIRDRLSQTWRRKILLQRQE